MFSPKDKEQAKRSSMFGICDIIARHNKLL